MMGKQSKRPARRERTRWTSPLSAHKQQGKVLTPPLRAIPSMRAVPWIPNTLPDLLWLCSVIAANEEPDGLLICSRTLDVVDDIVAPFLEGLAERDRPEFDGRLTSFERVPEEARASILAGLLARGLYDEAVPLGFAHALGMYPTAPGRWLLQPWLDRGISIDWEAARRFLAPVVAVSSHGQHTVPTHAKAVFGARYFKAGKIHIGPEVDFPLELLPRYPDRLTEDELKRVRPTIRSMFLALWNLKQEDDVPPSSDAWAQVFWRSNWRIYPCITEDSPSSASDGGSLEEARAGYAAHVEQLHEAFLDVALRSDPDLFHPDRYEVLTGITLRSLRLASAATSVPVLWTGEHGSPVLRSLVESLIVLRWLVKRDDPAMYDRFKAYGRGRLKLLKLHLEEYVGTLEDAPAELREYLEYLDAEVNQDLWEEWQTISIEGTFGGVSVRDMAAEVGMEREYRLQFAPASSATHGEWSSLDRYVLQRCRNPLHRGHRIPRTTLSTPIGPGLVESVLEVVEALVSDYKSAVGDGVIGGSRPAA